MRTILTPSTDIGSAMLDPFGDRRRKLQVEQQRQAEAEHRQAVLALLVALQGRPGRGGGASMNPRIIAVPESWREEARLLRLAQGAKERARTAAASRDHHSIVRALLSASRLATDAARALGKAVGNRPHGRQGELQMIRSITIDRFDTRDAVWETIARSDVNRFALGVSPTLRLRVETADHICEALQIVPVDVADRESHTGDLRVEEER